MSSFDNNLAVATFLDRSKAEHAVEKLLENGFAEENIGFVLPSDEAAPDEQAFSPARSEVIQGAETGSAAGLAVGGLAGAAAAAVFLPGVGPIVAGGFLAVLLGSAAGATAGGLLGALIGASVPEDDARLYERKFHLGHTLVTVKAGERYEEAVAILEKAQEWEPKLPHHGRGRLAALAGGMHTTGSASAFVPEP
jgi:hypothetical protein